MSTISSLSQPSAVFKAPIAVNSPTVSSSFGQALAVAESPNALLTTPELSKAHRPTLTTFMNRTGVPFLDASELIRGVVGSNKDVRDWAAIMGSDDPVSAARQATSQMYARTDITPRTNVTYMGPKDTLAREGNFAVRLLKDQSNRVLDKGLKLVDAQGLLLRSAGTSPKAIARNAWLFGLDTRPLAKLVDAAGVVSADLGQAVRQASTMAPSPRQNPATQTAAMRMAPENAKLLGLNTIAAAPKPAAASSPVAQSPDQGTSPALEDTIDKAATSTLAHIDSRAYLGKLFRA